MTISGRQEYPPLLPQGVYRLWLPELRSLCVSGFHLSTSRVKIMEGLESVVSILDHCGICGTLWIDGSFLTEKLDPQDVDIVLSTSSEFIDGLTNEQEDVLSWFSSDDLKPNFSCDSYLFIQYGPAHPLHGTIRDLYSYWRKWFGHDRNMQPKGIASLSLPLTDGDWLFQHNRNRLTRLSKRKRLSVPRHAK